MRSMLEQLENNEAVLLMYLADELPAEDRHELEALLQSDAGLRAGLDRLRHMQSEMTAMLAQGDQQVLAPALEATRALAASRRISAAWNRLKVEQLAAPANVTTSRIPYRRLLPTWVYPIAAAAVILIAFVSYLSLVSGVNSSQVAHQRPFVENPGTGAMVDLQPSPSVETPRNAVVPSLAVDQADRELIAISAGSYDVSSMFQSQGE